MTVDRRKVIGLALAAALTALGSGQSFETSMGQPGLRAADFEAQVARRLRP